MHFHLGSMAGAHDAGLVSYASIWLHAVFLQAADGILISIFKQLWLPGASTCLGVGEGGCSLQLTGFSCSAECTIFIIHSTLQACIIYCRNVRFVRMSGCDCTS